MRKGTDADDLDAGVSYGADGAQIDAARGFQGDLAADDVYGTTLIIQAEIIQHDDVRAMGEGLFQLIQAVDLHLDLNKVTGEGTGTGQGLANPAAGRHMVVLNEDSVIQAEAVIDPAAAAHRVLFQMS